MPDKLLRTFQTHHPDVVKGFIKELERDLIQNVEQVDVPIQHHFSKGVYAREMKVKAGTLIVGKTHRHQNLSIISEGEVSVLTDQGVERYKAPHTFVAPPGVKRVIYAHTDCTWTVIHATELTDLKEIEKEFIVKDRDEVEALSHSDIQKLTGEKS